MRHDRTKFPKGGRLQSWKESHDLKRIFMRFIFLNSSLVGTSTRARFNLSKFVLPPPSLLLPLVFYRLDDVFLV
jgi:hypothetical protein